MENVDMCMSLLEPEEREQIEFMWNLIPAEDRQGMRKEDLLFVLDAMDDYMEEAGLMEVDEKTGEVTYLDGDVDETEQMNFVVRAVAEGANTQQCNPLTQTQIQLVLDAELQYGIEQGYYEDED